ncbi:MAG: hypothetical protein J6I66_03545 [Lachnospiraceae bacterium]|nr:hypothetical protein [Lachnospiraceae bacterium]
MEKRGISFGRMVGIYVISIMCLIGITVLITLISVATWMNSDSYVEPGEIEREVENWVDQTKTSGEFDMSSFPENAGCIMTDEDGNEVYTALDGSDEKNFRNFIKQCESYPESKVLQGQDVYLKLTIDGTSAYIHYNMGVGNEYLILAGVILLLILEVAVPTVILIHVVKKAVGKAEEHAEKLKSHDLSGEGFRTGIREMDEIALAMDDLKKSLSDSLESKWRDEQKTKADMAQIAHDLKTPLTIIRGNADLLLESADNADDKESIQSIIENAEKITRSILEILEMQE